MVVLSNYPGDPRPARAAAALAGQGMSVDYICLTDGKSPKREKTNGIDVTRLPFQHRRGGKLSYFTEYSSCITASGAIMGMRALRCRYDLVYINNMPDILVLSSLVPKMLGAKVVLDMHDPMPELMETIFGLGESTWAVRTIKRLERWSMAWADLVITVNIACRRIFGNRSCAPEKIGVVMNSPDEKIFPFHPARSVRKARSKDDPFVIMYHGSLLERNGVDLAVEAVAKIRPTLPSAVLRIYGHSTPFLERVMKSVQERGLGDAVQYLGPKKLKDLVPEIEQCDVGVIPNHRNAFTDINTPTRIFEYLAPGRPVIAPRTRGITDYFDNDALVFFESGDAADLAHRMEYVASHPEEVLQIVERGQQVYGAHTWEQERKTLVRLVSELLRDREHA